MTRPLALVFSAAILLWSHAASAKPKVALTQIEGDASGDVRDAVAEALEGKELALIGSKEVNRAVDKLGDLADLTEKDFKKLANELEADAIVLGKLDKVGSSKTLKFRLYVHKKMAKGFTVSFKDAKSEKFRAMLHDKMIDKIGVAGGDADEERPAKKKTEDDDEALAKKDKGKKGKKAKAEEDEEVRPAKKKVADDEEARPAKKKLSDDEDARPAKKKVAEEEEARPKKKVVEEEEARPAKKKVVEDDDAKPADKPSEDEDAPRKAKKKVAAAEESEDGADGEASVTARIEAPRSANRVPIRLDLGASVVQRTFKFNATNIPEKPRNPPLSPVPGARIEGEIYPLAMNGSRGALAGLGIGGEYDRTLSLNLRAEAEPAVTVPVKQSHWSIGARYRLVFGQTETSPTLTLGVGYGKRLFSPDRSKLTMDAAKADIGRDTPNVNYTVIDPGLMFRFPVTRLVALAAGGHGLIITNAGAIQNADSYGRARVYGFEGIAAVDVVLGSHIALRFSGEFTQVGFTFDGVGALSNNLDGNTETKDVGGLADRSIGGSATIAILY